ncbi:MAG: hypothetical protein ACI857_003428 [Arenicella sp.]|jgi:hypothetical protein
MKNALLIIFGIIPVLSFSQKFEISKNYIFNDIEPLRTSEYFSVADSIRDPLIIKIREKSNGEVKEEIEIFSAESFCSVCIHEQELTGYKNVTSAVRVGYDYCGCCSEVYETTYLVTKKGKWIPFPEVIYHTCDYPEEKPAFRFGSDNGPVVQEIQKVTEFRNNQGDLYNSKILETYLWNGKFIVKKED